MEMDVYAYRRYFHPKHDYILLIGTTVFKGNLHYIDGIGPTWIIMVDYQGYQGYDYNLYVTFIDIFGIIYVWHILQYLDAVNDYVRASCKYNSNILEISDYILYHRKRYTENESKLPDNEIYIKVMDKHDQKVDELTGT